MAERRLYHEVFGEMLASDHARHSQATSEAPEIRGVDAMLKEIQEEQQRLNREGHEGEEERKRKVDILNQGFRLGLSLLIYVVGDNDEKTLAA